MKGVFVTKEDGVIKESVIKLNYIFTISRQMIKKRLFHLPDNKKKKVFDELIKRLGSLIS